MNTIMDQWSKYTLMQRYNKIWTKSRRKIKAKCSYRKREHSLNDKSAKIECSWQMKNGVSPPRVIFWGPTIYCSKQNKTKQTENKSKNAPRKMHSTWSNKNIVCWKVTWFLPMKKGCLRGIPKIWRLYLFDISWGDMGIPKLELLSILHLISSFYNPYTWKLPSYKTSHNSISNISINIIVNQLLLFQVSTQKHHM
jgi:hypothetical protein